MTWIETFHHLAMVALLSVSPDSPSGEDQLDHDTGARR